MMGERTVAQEALFYEFSLERHVPRITCFGQSTGSWTCPVSATSCGPSTARAAAPPLIPS